jgi:hypothetical protein
MIHDKLLAEIDSYAYVYKPKTALRAVVELHKPWLSKHDDLVMCDHCCSEVYPCPTIQAIKKELI